MLAKRTFREARAWLSTIPKDRWKVCANYAELLPAGSSSLSWYNGSLALTILLLSHLTPPFSPLLCVPIGRDTAFKNLYRHFSSCICVRQPVKERVRCDLRRLKNRLLLSLRGSSGTAFCGFVHGDQSWALAVTLNFSLVTNGFSCIFY